jgi:hypothetical protein
MVEVLDWTRGAEAEAGGDGGRNGVGEAGLLRRGVGVGTRCGMRCGMVEFTGSYSSFSWQSSAGCAARAIRFGSAVCLVCARGATTPTIGDTWWKGSAPLPW